MTTVINTPSNGESTGTGFILGAVVVIVLLGLFFVYGLPAIRNNAAAKDTSNSIDVNLKLPSSNNNTNGSAY